MKGKKGKDIEKELQKRVSHYEKLTSRALKKAKITVPKDSFLHGAAVDFREMAQSYFSDAQHFAKKGELPLALAAFSYAHAWLDAGARLGLFDVRGDHELFTLYR